MRLLQSVLATSPQTKKPQRKFIAHLLGLLLMLPGHATFRNLSRYSSYHERTIARWGTLLPGGGAIFRFIRGADSLLALV